MPTSTILFTDWFFIMLIAQLLLIGIVLKPIVMATITGSSPAQ